MSDTIVDMAKVTQMLDSGWQVCLHKNRLGGYAACALRNVVSKDSPCRRVGQDVQTDDMTPEQALTRLAYKVQGEII